MRIGVSAEECRKDSPKFRADIEASEQNISQLEARLEKVIKLCNGMIEAGKAFGNANSAFIGGIQEVTSHFTGDPILEVVVDLASQSITRDLHWLIRTDLRQVKESQTKFRRASDDLDSALNKHVSASKTKPLECDEAANHLLVSRSKFTAMTVEYTDKLNVFSEKQRYDVLQTMFSYLTAQSTYFHQGFDLFDAHEDFTKDVAIKLVELSDRTLLISKESEARHKEMLQVLTSDTKLDADADDKSNTSSSTENQDKSSEENVNIAGFLYRRTSKGFKSWVRRWFTISKNQLIYTKKLSEGWTTMEEDLRLCNVKPYSDGERRFCFEVKSPKGSHVLQATDEEECLQWISALQAGVVNAYRDRAHTLSTGDNNLNSFEHSRLSQSHSMPILDKQRNKSRTASQMALLFTIPGNDLCADCESREPRWASVNLGITLCIECSGVHRSLGVHISKVRSITLDTWEPEVLKVMAELGNTAVNSIYEYSYIPEDGRVPRPSSGSANSTREAFIKAKYVERLYVKPLVPQDKSSTVKRWTVARRQRRTLLLDSMADDTEAASISDAVVSGSAGDRTTAGTPDDDTVVLFGSSVNDPVDKLQCDLLPAEDDVITGTEDTPSHTGLEELERLDPNLLLYKASEARNIPVILQALANRADVNYKNAADLNKTALIKAVESGSLATCEFLLLNLANVDSADDNNQPALHHATLKGHTAQVCQLLKRGANYKHKDNSGSEALTLAVAAEHADIVTLLRVASLRQEMTDADPGSLTDDSFNDIFRDFTHLASNDPEKLKRGNGSFSAQQRNTTKL